MTTEQIDKLCNVGKRKNFNAVELSQYITQPPYNLSAAEASEVYFAYKNRYNGPTAYSVKGTQTGRFVKTDLSKVEGQVIAAVTKAPRKKHEHTPSALVRAATKDFALTVSGKKKNGKFRRVGKKFIQTIEADLENIVRDIGPRNPHSEDDIPGDWDFVNHLRIWPKLAEQLNRAIRRRIFERVMSQPSIGKTLK